MKILVTGASGFTGQHFLQAAHRQGHDTTILQARLHDRAALEREIAACGPAAVVHLAGISSSAATDSSAFYDVNVVGTVNLLDVLTLLPTPPRVLLTSSANVYGDGGIAPLGEGANAAPVDHYGMSKLAMEMLARNYTDRLPLFVVRPFNYTGVGQRDCFVIPKLVNLFASRAAVVELGNLDVSREFLDVRFVCAAMLRLLDVAESGATYNICSGVNWSLVDVLALLSQLSGHTPRIVSAPALVRRTDIDCLRGDPTRLRHAIGPLEVPALADTLAWMLRAAQQEGACA